MATCSALYAPKPWRQILSIENCDDEGQHCAQAKKIDPRLDLGLGWRPQTCVNTDPSWSEAYGFCVPEGLVEIEELREHV